MHLLPLPVTPRRTTAVISPCMTYRYALTRRWWEDDAPTVCWVMLNPSTADAEQDDPTIRRCISFSKAWGYGGLTVVNLFALRATNPKELYAHPDPVGPDNDEHIYAEAWTSELTIAAWGVHGAFQNRGLRIRRLLLRDREDGKANDATRHLGLTKGGHPRHPLYVKGDTKPIEWEAS